MSRNDFDVIVVGGGLVGAAAALALDGLGLRVALVEGEAPGEAPDTSWDSRIYAVSPGSQRFLEALGVWRAMDAGRLQPVTAMQVVGDDGLSRLEFSAYEAGVGALAWIVESRLMHGALWQALASRSRVQLRVPARLAGLACDADAARVTLESGERLSAALVVGADGARSRVRALAGIGFRDKDYGQLGVVANFACERPHGGIARQWFRRDGILAWLPLPGNRMSMVWSTPTAHAQALLGCDARTLCERVAAAGANALGRLELITPAAGFPLHLIQVDALSAPRLALIGDAAHQVHPLAGQGVNLGFQDAEQLAATLAARGPRDVGDVWLLRRYERARKEDVIAMQAVTDGLKELFGSESGVIAALRNLGLGLTQRLGPVKQRLVRHALGV